LNAVELLRSAKIWRQVRAHVMERTVDAVSTRSGRSEDTQRPSCAKDMETV
jgi:hypothetical protein